MILTLIPLTIMLILTMFSLINGGVITTQTTSIDNATVYVNGSTATVNWPTTAFDFSITTTVGAITIIGVAILIAFIGVRVLGTGLSEFSIQIIYKAIMYLGIWGVLTALSLNSITSIPTFGWIIYFALTFMYVFGFLMDTSRGSSMD